MNSTRYYGLGLTVQKVGLDFFIKIQLNIIWWIQ